MSKIQNDSALRPLKFQDIIGMEETKERLAMSISAAKERNEPLGHVLIDGGRGLGKSSLSFCIANEIGTNLHIANAATIKTPRDLIQVLHHDIEYGDVLFVDEIHSLPRPVEEFLYSAMEDFRIDIPMGRSRNVVSMDIEPFTMIGATTHVGKVSSPMRDRFRFREQLQHYSHEDIAKIVAVNSRKLGFDIALDAAYAIAERSRNTPRVSVNNLMWVRDYASFTKAREITQPVVIAAMEKQGIDSMGLTENDRKYMETLYNIFGGGPTGVKSLANTLLIADITLEDDIEPYLLNLGLILRTSSGRQLTTAGFEYFRNKTTTAYL